MRVRVPQQSILGKSCVKCHVLKHPTAFKLHTKTWPNKAGEMVRYTHHDNTCRQCRWAAIKDRVNARRRKGGCAAGENNGQAVLTDDWATFIKSRTGRKIPNTKLAAWSGVSPSTIHLCKAEKTWNKNSIK